MKVRHGRATVSGSTPRSQIRSASPLLSVASRKGNEMFFAVPFFVLLAIGATCSALGCSVPLAGLAAAAALNLPRRAGIALVAAVWFVDQLIGFTLRGYPRTPSTLVWALALGLASLGAYAIARALRWNLFAAFSAAFFAFQLVLVVFSVWLGGWDAYEPRWLVEILAINAAWFIGAHVTLRLLAKQPVFNVDLNASR